MFNYNEAMQPKQREKAVYDNIGTFEHRIVMYYVLKEYTTDGTSVYIWHKVSHSSDVYWFRAKLEWGKGGQEHGYLGGGGDS